LQEGLQKEVNLQPSAISGILFYLFPEMEEENKRSIVKVQRLMGEYSQQ
jgi:hypothetical protein